MHDVRALPSAKSKARTIYFFQGGNKEVAPSRTTKPTRGAISLEANVSSARANDESFVDSV